MTDQQLLSSRRLMSAFADLIRDRGWRDPGYTALDLATAALEQRPRPVSQRVFTRVTAQLRVRNGLTKQEVADAFAPLLERVRQITDRAA